MYENDELHRFFFESLSKIKFLSFTSPNDNDIKKTFILIFLDLQGQLYAIGGNDGTSSLSRCESYDPFVNKWTPIADMGCRRAGAGVGVLDGFIYAVGR